MNIQTEKDYSDFDLDYSIVKEESTVQDYKVDVYEENNQQNEWVKVKNVLINQ